MTSAVVRRRWWTVGVTVLALAAAGRAGIADGLAIWSPEPAATVLPILASLMVMGEGTSWRWVHEFGVPCLIGPALLFAWYPGLLSGANTVPRRSTVGLLLLSVLTLVDFALEWKHGIQYHGEQFVRGTFIVNVLAGCIAWALMRLAYQRMTFATTLTAHAWVVAWLVWFAFPWLGEPL
jgi:hypothetical protein